jgi:FixJ family two-component response regulator
MTLDDAARVYVVEDDLAENQLFVLVARRLGLDSVGLADVAALWNAVDRSRPGCVLADVQLPGASGLELLGRLDAVQLPLPTILITGQASIPLCVEAMQRGAFDFLEKPVSIERLQQSLLRAVAWSRSRWEKRAAVVESPPVRLTREEGRVLELLLEGKSNKQMAAQMDISIRTVQFRIASLLKKFQAESRTALVHRMLHAQRGPHYRVDSPGEASSLPHWNHAPPSPTGESVTRPGADRPSSW